MLAIALGALAIGVLYYALARRPEHVYFIAHWLPAHYASRAALGGIGAHIPTFLHVYSFILLTMVFTAADAARLIPICMAWFTLETIFEIAQLHSIALWIAAHTPSWFTGIPFLENAANYFLFGTFDILDLLSIATGTLAAYMTVLATQVRLVHDKEA